MINNNIRKNFGKVLGGALTDKEWNRLKELLYVEEVSEGGFTIKQAAIDLRRTTIKHSIFNRFFLKDIQAQLDMSVPSKDEGEKSSVKNLKSGETSEEQRAFALSLLFASDASQDSGVKVFRYSFLNDHLLDPSEVKKWIEKHSETDGPPSKWLSSIPLPIDMWVSSKDERIIEIRRKDALRYGFQRESRLLDFVTPDDDEVRHMAIVSGGVLE